MADTGTTNWRTAAPLVAKAGIDAELCTDLIRYASTAAHSPRTYQGVLDESQRKSDYTEIPGPLEERLFSQVEPVMEQHFGVRVQRIPAQQCVAYRYGEGVGFVAHHDEVTDIEREHARTNGQPVVGGDITVVTWLSGPDEYQGGALFFQEPPIDLRPPRGSVVAFPATRDHVHGVRPITAGLRTTVILRVAVADGSPPR
ncbi:2OG-Fe(II) oxygenase [Streptomyces phytophilus]|uniref:2OG-Fe(II) oxygenase n=1 Tax=Streptomyces phytophilus TaxID=722715 RepID=UPI0015EFDD1E|nr:2OG-Fe(II) oxygenase [Streptomyces phytophilus]